MVRCVNMSCVIVRCVMVRCVKMKCVVINTAHLLFPQKSSLLEVRPWSPQLTVKSPLHQRKCLRQPSPRAKPGHVTPRDPVLDVQGWKEEVLSLASREAVSRPLNCLSVASSGGRHRQPTSNNLMKMMEETLRVMASAELSADCPHFIVNNLSAF